MHQLTPEEHAFINATLAEADAHRQEAPDEGDHQEHRIILQSGPGGIISLVYSDDPRAEVVILEQMIPRQKSHPQGFSFQALNALCAWWLTRPQCTVAPPTRHK